MVLTLVSTTKITSSVYFSHNINPAAIIVAREIEENHNVVRLMFIWDPADRLSVLKTSSNPMLLVLAQFDSLTSGTSLGSAKVMYTDCGSSRLSLDSLGVGQSTHII